MKIIYNKYLPFGSFEAVNIFGFVFAKKDSKPLGEKTKRHEAIHTRQIREMMFVFFYLWYGVEYVVRLIQFRNFKEAYRNVSFEREAYANDYSKVYLKKREPFNFLGYLWL